MPIVVIFIRSFWRRRHVLPKRHNGFTAFYLCQKASPGYISDIGGKHVLKLNLNPHTKSIGCWHRSCIVLAVHSAVDSSYEVQ